MNRFGVVFLFLWIPLLCSGQEQDIFQAVQSGQMDKIEEMLKADPLPINAVDRAGRTPLFIAGNPGDFFMLSDGGIK